jgi:hypothetical protein
MATSSADYRLDQWHWKSTRSNPTGQADDKWLGLQKDPADTESAHYADAQDGGGEILNQDDARSGPVYMNGVDLNSPFILAGQEAPLDLTLLAAGAIVPGYILAPVTGSRGDLSVQGTWADGKWVVVIRRALDTGHPEDVLFTPPKPVPFGVAIVDNGGGYDHDVVENVLILEWR